MTANGLWPEGYGDYVRRIVSPSQFPPTREEEYSDHRNRGREEQVERQLTVENLWRGSPLERVWEQLRGFASPADNYLMDRSKLVAFARHAGVASPLLRGGIADLFLSGLSKYVRTTDGASGRISALHLCKALEISLEDETFRRVLAAHCFSDLAAVVSNGRGRSYIITRDRIGVCVENLMRDFKPQGDERKERLLGTIERLLATQDAMTTSHCTDLSLETFTALFFAADSGYLVSTFLKHILEVAARQLRTPFGSFPVLPLCWVNLTVAAA